MLEYDTYDTAMWCQRISDMTDIEFDFGHVAMSRPSEVVLVLSTFFKQTCSVALWVKLINPH